MMKQTAKLAERVARMRKLLEKEMLNTSQIAARLGIARGCVLRIARDAGLEHRIEKRRSSRVLFTGSDF